MFIYLQKEKLINIFEYLEKFDSSLFFSINNHMHFKVLDFVMILISHPPSLVLYLLIGAFLIGLYIIKKPFPLKPIIFLIVAVGLTDYICSELLKPFFARLRPCRDTELYVRLVASCAGEFGFPSNHSANTASFATSVYLLWPSIKKHRFFLCVLILLPLLTGFSRIYLGAHYPFDVISGYIFGSLFSIILIILMWTVQQFHNFYQKPKRKR